MESPGLITFRYMERFSCLGGACEDTCCGGWTVSIDELHYTRLGRLLPPAVHAASFSPRAADARSALAFATIRMRQDTQRCPLLDEDGWCGVHRRLGEPELPDVCSSYPRVVSDIGGRLELAGSLSCPEVVRQALLSDDGMERVEVDRALLGRAPIVERPPPDEAMLVDELRGFALMLMDGEASLGVKIATLGWLAETADAALDAAPAAAPGDRSGATELLSDELESALDEDTLAEIHGEIARAATTPEAGAAVTMQVLALLSMARGALLDELRAILAIAEERGLIVPTEDGHAMPPEWTDAWAHAVAAVPAARRAWVDAWLARYATHVIWRDPPLRRGSVFAWVRALTVRLAALRFLILLHPALAARASDDQSTNPEDHRDDEAARAFTRLVYRIARIVEHDFAAAAHLEGHLAALVPSLSALWAVAALVAESGEDRVGER